MHSTGQHIIQSFRNRFVQNRLLASGIMGIAVTFLLSAITYNWFHISYWYAFLYFILFFVIDVFISKPWQTTDTDIVRFLNSHNSQLEESAELYLLPASNLSLLQQLQLQKIDPIFQQLKLPDEFSQRLKKSIVILLASVLLSTIILYASNYTPHQNLSAVSDNSKTSTTAIPIQPAVHSKVSVSIIPPAYTGRPGRTQSDLSVTAEEGATVNWIINTSAAVQKVQLIFNDGQPVNMHAKEGNKEWTLSKKITASGFYQLIIDSTQSSLNKLSVIADEPTVIKITSPAQYTTIEPGKARLLSLKVLLSDDYGIRNASIQLTKASGKGEGVSFKEQQLSFNTAFNNSRQMNLAKIIDLRSLGMVPGDELYFYIRAMDNHGAESRSDMYFVSLADTAELMSLSGLTSSVNLVPEYFRSQRQIIIDTEKLLAEKSSISQEEYNNRCNNLGIDQKLLRLRYGKFLGEESETNIGESHDEHDEHEGAHGEEKFGDVQSIMDQYAHKHDNSEDATFFEPEQKKQLKATLTEMWNAELKLRTYKAPEALPYEYKALRLLKDLQQQSRAYVAKTTFKTPALKPEKRLTGELTAITNPVLHQQNEADKQSELLQQSAAVINGLLFGRKPNQAEQQYLIAVEKKISASAAANPANYLPALSAIRTIIAQNGHWKLTDIALAEAAIQQLIQQPDALPQPSAKAPQAGLSQLYFNHLKKKH